MKLKHLKRKVSFEIKDRVKENGARLGVIKVERNGKIYEVNTPALSVVGTKAAVKGVSADELTRAKTQIVLANTYHLMLEPGEKIIKKFGGLNSFMNWEGVSMTDSGGFQVFSLGFGKDHHIGKLGFFPGDASEIYEEKNFLKQQPKDLKITEEGVVFRDYKSGDKIFLTPEKSIKIQEDIGADIIFAFDECTSPLAGYDYTKYAMERTHRWAARCIKTKLKNGQALFGIIQGGAYKDLRERSIDFIASLPFDGFGIGGSLGKSKKERSKIMNWFCGKLPENKPRHMLGIGDFEGVIEAVKLGVDTFDCVAPTREARNGRIYTRAGFLQIRNSEFKNDNKILEKGCGCFACENNYFRGYIRHLLKSNEMFGMRLATLHNIYFMNTFFEDLRKNIYNINKWGREFLKKFKR